MCLFGIFVGINRFGVQHYHDHRQKLARHSLPHLPAQNQSQLQLFVPSVEMMTCHCEYGNDLLKDTERML
jgi:hypothetical protein